MKNQRIHRKNFSVNSVNYQMPTPAAVNLFNFQPACLKNLITDLVWVQKDMDNIASYIPDKDIRAIIDTVMDKVKNDIAFVEGMHKKAYVYNKEFFNCSKEVVKTNLVKLNNKELSKIYNHLASLYKKGHNWALSTTWFVDSDNGDLSNFILGRLKDILAGKKADVPQVFSDLTTPEGNSFGVIEEKASLNLLLEIKKNAKVKRIFLNNDLDEIKLKLKIISPTIYRKIIKHKEKYDWLPFGYIGPAYSLDYFLSVWQGLLKEKFLIQKRLKEIGNYASTVRNKRKNLFVKYNIKPKDKRLFDLAADIIYLKAYRKDSCYLGMYAIHHIMKEVAKRLHLSQKQVGFMASWEVAQALKDGIFSEQILNERTKFSVYHQTLKKGIIYTGQQAKNFLNKCNLEKIKISSPKQLIGMTAYPGKATGEVKIINIPEDMWKMNEGDILVAHTTAPALLPAMKKAAAIITDDGGITCHAAIVSRELKIPCVVGIKTATQALRDNDKVKVDAGKGTLDILKK